MKRLSIIFLIIYTSAQGQNFSGFRRFSVPYSKACAPVTVSVSSHDMFGNVPRGYIYEPGQTAVTDTFYIYKNPGIYQIVQITGADVPIKNDTLTLEVVTPQPPQFNVFKCSGTEALIEITNEYYDYHIVKFTTTDSVIVTAGDPSPTYDFGSTKGNVQVIGYFSDGYPNCGDTSEIFNVTDPVEASLISANINEGCENEFYLNLLITVDPLTKYEIEFQQGSGAYQSIYVGKIAQFQNIFPVDFDLSKPSYCVRVNKLNACNSQSTTSSESCYTLDVTSIRPLTNSYASYVGSSIFLNIPTTSSDEIMIERKYGNGDIYSFIQSTQTNYTDQIPHHFRQYQYLLSQQDTCGTMIDSVIVAAPFLKIIDKDPLTNEVVFNLDDAINQLGSYEAFLMIYNSDSSLATDIPFETNFTLPALIGDQLNMIVRLDYISGTSIYSNKITTSYEMIIFIPKAFTPNGDGQNDNLELFGLPTNEFEIEIYNRWGESIHQKINENPVWNGKIDNKTAPEGTYLYKLIFTLPDGKLKTQVGTFVLLKK